MTTVTSTNSPYNVSSGQTDHGDIVASGGSMFVLSGGVADATTVDTGSFLTINSGGTASGTILVAGGTSVAAAYETVSSGGTDLATNISLGGQATVYGFASGTIISSGGLQTIDVGGVTSSASIDSGGTQYIAHYGFGDTGTAIATTVSSGGVQVDGDYTGAQGTAISTTISSGGVQDIAVEGAHGTAVNTWILGGGQIVGDGGGEFSSNGGLGVAVSTTISTGAQYVGYGGTGSAVSTTIESGTQIVGFLSGGTGTAIGTTVESGGLQDVALIGGKGKVTSTTIESGGTENVFAGGTSIATIIDGGTLQVGVGAVLSGALTFSGAGGTIQIDGTAMPTTVISGLAIGDVIDLAGVTFSNGASATESGNLLKVVDGGKTYDLHLAAGNYTADAFQVSADSGSGTQIVVSPNPAPPVVVSATSPESGAYGVGRTVTFTLDTSLPVNVTGTPTLTLNDGGTATYVSGTGTNDLTFSYTVGSGQNASQLTTSLSTLAGGTIEGITGTPVGASTTPIKLGTLGANTTMVADSTVKLSANTEAALQAAIDIAASGEIIDPSATLTLSSQLTIPTGTDVTIDGFEGGSGAFDAMQWNADRPIVIQQGTTVAFEYVDINFSESLGTAGGGADGGNGPGGQPGTAGFNGTAPGQAGANGTDGSNGSDGGNGGSGVSLLGAIENYGTLSLDHVAVVAKSEANDGGTAGVGGTGGKGGNGGSGAGGYSGGGGAGAKGGDAGDGGNGGVGGDGGTAVGAIYNVGSLTLANTLITGSATGGDGGDGEDGGKGGNGGEGGNGGNGTYGGPGGGAGHGGNAGNGGNAGLGGDGGSAYGGILNEGSLTVAGSTVLFDDDAEAGNGGNGGKDPGEAGEVGAAGRPGSPRGATSVPGSPGSNGAGAGAGILGTAIADYATTNPINGTLTIDRHMYEFDPRSLSPATASLASKGTKFTYTVDNYGPDTSGAVQWKVVTGIPSTDFVGPESGTLNFADGAKSGTISVTLKPDSSQGASESFTVELIAPSNGDVLGSNSTIVQNVANPSGARAGQVEKPVDDATLGYAASGSSNAAAPTLLGATASAAVALLGSYMASTFVAAAHSGTLISAQAHTSAQQPLVASPHA